MNSLVVGIATYTEPEEGTQWYKEYHECTESWNNEAWQHRPVYEVLGMRIIPAYNEIWQKTTEDIIAFAHNDVIIYSEDEPWDLKVLKEFDDPKVGIVGLFGGKNHGSPNLYNEEFKVINLARGRCFSNARSIPVERLKGSTEVTVIDGYFIAVRREVLNRVDGWNPNATYYLFSEALTCSARRLGYKIRVIGLDHDHLSGRTSTHANVTDSFEDAHKWLYNEYKDVLPSTVNE